MADVEHPRPSYQHHAGFYRKIMPGDDLKPWEWSPVTDHSLPMSPMRPVFQMSKAYPPGLEPSSTFMVVKAPANGAKKKGLWAAIRRFLRFGRFCYLYRLILTTLNYFMYSVPFPDPDKRSCRYASPFCAARSGSRHRWGVCVESSTL